MRSSMSCAFPWTTFFLFFLCSSNTFSLISYSTYAVEYLICSVELSLSLFPNLHFSSTPVHVSVLIVLIQNRICSDTTYSETFLQFPIFSTVCPQEYFLISLSSFYIAPVMRYMVPQIQMMYLRNT